MTGPRKIPSQAGFEPWIFCSQGGRLNHSAIEVVTQERFANKGTKIGLCQCAEHELQVLSLNIALQAVCFVQFSAACSLWYSVKQVELFFDALSFSSTPSAAHILFLDFFHTNPKQEENKDENKTHSEDNFVGNFT